MTESIDRLLDQLDDGCPRCGTVPTDAKVRATEVVLVPCGHVVDATLLPRVKPPEAYDEGTDE